jgi:GNAT superfamily N-acetyltransferase
VAFALFAYLCPAEVEMDVNQFRIRKARAGDGQSAHRLIVALGYPNLSVDEFAQVFSEVLSRSESLVLLAEDLNGRAVGIMTISNRPQLRLAGTILCIDELSVLDEVRGLGIGRALLNKAKSIAGEIKAKRIELNTNRSRDSYARNFYVKNGFLEASSAILRLDLNPDCVTKES